jgi:hypothetical protein
MMSEKEKEARALFRPPATRRVALDLIEADLAAPGNGRHNFGQAIPPRAPYDAKGKNYPPRCQRC